MILNFPFSKLASSHLRWSDGRTFQHFIHFDIIWGMQFEWKSRIAIKLRRKIVAPPLLLLSYIKQDVRTSKAQSTRWPAPSGVAPSPKTRKHPFSPRNHPTPLIFSVLSLSSTPRESFGSFTPKWLSYVVAVLKSSFCIKRKQLVQLVSKKISFSFLRNKIESFLKPRPKQHSKTNSKVDEAVVFAPNNVTIVCKKIKGERLLSHNWLSFFQDEKSLIKDCRNVIICDSIKKESSLRHF